MQGDRSMNKNTRIRPDWFKRLNAPYRLVFINDESLEEVASLNLTKSKIYMLFSTLFVFIVMITVMILLFTPLKYYIPGYGTDQNRIQVIKMKHSIDSLSEMVDNQQKMAENLKMVIVGKYKGPSDTTMLDMERVRTEDMKSILPSADVIKQQAIPGSKRNK